MDSLDLDGLGEVFLYLLIAGLTIAFVGLCTVGGAMVGWTVSGMLLAVILGATGFAMSVCIVVVIANLVRS